MSSPAPRHALELVVGAVLAMAVAEGLSACADDEAPPAVAAPAGRVSLETAPYPPGPYGLGRGDVLADASFEGVDAEGRPTTLHLGDVYAPDAPARVLLVAVSGGLWCGTCRWFGRHGGEIVSGSGARVVRLDLVVGSRDNAPAAAEDAARWQQSFGIHAPVGADPSFVFGGARDGGEGALPLFLFVDTRSMRLVDVLASPDDDALRAHLAKAIADVTSIEEAPPPPASPLVDGLFHRSEWELLQETTLPDAPPADPTNAAADDPRAVALGKRLFFDAGLSPSGTIACATCHAVDKGLADGRPIAIGARAGTRRTPAIGLAAHARWQFWDGRADSLWAQALGPIESDTELGSSRAYVGRYVAARYPVELAAVFHRKPRSTASWPPSGKPGDAKYDALPSEDRDAITEILVDTGKAIAAYERTFRVAPNALDGYLRGDLGALGPDAKYGLELFVREGCMQCHWGPRLTDDAFHDTRIPRGPNRDARIDRGRADGLALWAASDFRGDGRWSDDRSVALASAAVSPRALGQFKTPALRGAGDLAFFGHDGAFHDLSGVAETYGRGGVPDGDSSSVGKRDAWLPTFGETAQWGLVPFLQALKAEPIVP